ncbi:hypothetical protein CCYN74_20024 [Capnocytophaga cynodegmi]|uniref:Uncharacterized protein n=1 Tax=Capnocytophaga cynodegmi TaxID=28189 RepID=A0A0B7HGP7_9FLAO|nr:hypothetical protein CCYN74_20024 [Capnocytophaga cynodegmi]
MKANDKYAEILAPSSISGSNNCSIGFIRVEPEIIQITKNIIISVNNSDFVCFKFLFIILQ